MSSSSNRAQPPGPDGVQDQEIVGALQSGYLPWLGFFDQVYHSDIFILYDDLQFVRKSWRNRNRIKGPEGPLWLTVPVRHRYGQRICDVRIDNSRDWRRTHCKAIEHCYRRARYFSRYAESLLALYKEPWELLTDLNLRIIRFLLGAFGIEARIVVSSELGLEEGFWETGPKDGIATRRIIHFMNRMGARRFLEGQAGEQYLDPELLAEAGITIRFQHYAHEPYPQLFGDFMPFLSAVDLLFNCGPRSLDVLVNPSPFE